MLRLLFAFLLMGLGILPKAVAANDCETGHFLTLRKGPQSWHISEETIHQLAQAKRVTSTHWSRSGTYAGPLLADVIALAAFTTKPKKLKIYTWDNFRSSLPYDDLSKYGVILATSFNGKRLTLADWGPSYIVYPYDDFSELKSPAGLMKMVWQVCSIEIE